jgi:hypothetical protein
MAKRARERARLERQEAKRVRRLAIAEEAAQPVALPDEPALMEEFRRLSERHAAGLVGLDDYEKERHRIFVELRIESDETS